MRKHVLLASIAIALAWLIARTFAADEPHRVAEPTESTPSPQLDAPTHGWPTRTTSVGRIEGFVGDGKKRGIAGARVCASIENAEGFADREVTRCAITGEDGRYAIESVLATRHQVIASARGFVSAYFGDGTSSSWVDVVAGDTSRAIDFQLQPGGVAVTGRVEDPLGRPVLDAKVVATRTTLGAVPFADVETRTDASGSFTVWVPEGPIEIVADAEGYAESSDAIVAPNDKVVVRLGWESIVVGRVLDASTQMPVGDALVSAVGTDGEGARRVRSGADGTFRIAGLAGGRYRVDAIAPGRHGVATSTVAVGVSETSDEVTVVMRAAARVAARVLLEGGAPCREGNLSMRLAYDGTFSSTSIDAEGWARFDALPPGTYEPTASCEGHASQAKQAPIEIGTTDRFDLAFVILRGQSVKGIVVDEAGHPLPNASLSASLVEPKPGASSWVRGLVAKDGTFVIHGVPAGKWKIEAWGGTLVDATTEVTVPEGTDVSGVRILLHGGSTVVGKVTDADGRAVAGVEVSLSADKQGDPWRRTLTRADGTYVLHAVAPGAAHVDVSRTFSRLTLLSPVADPNDGDGAAAVTIAAGTNTLDLKVEREVSTITGLVVDSAGKPAAYAMIDFERETHEGELSSITTLNRIVTDATGRFTLPRLANAKYSIRARKKGFGDAYAFSVTAPSNIALALPASATVNGTVMLASGEIPARCEVWLETIDRHELRTEKLVNESRFSFDDVAPGRYKLEFRSAEGEAEQIVEIAAGQTITRTGVLTKKKTKEVEPEDS